MKFLSGLLLIGALVVACAKDTTTGGTNNGTPSNPSTGGAGAGTTGFASQGTINGGGGVGLQCGNHLEMLDIYEARAAGLTMLKTPANEDEAATLTAGLLATHFWNLDTVPAQQVAAGLATGIVKPIFEGGKIGNVETHKDETVEFVDSLPLSMDYGKYTVPAGCQLTQIAYFSDATTNLKIVKSARAKMDWLSYSVLAAHEVIFMMDRREGLERLLHNTAAITSAQSRAFVGRLFSTTPPSPKNTGVPAKDKVYICRNGGANLSGTYFYAFEVNGGVRAVFNIIMEKSSMYQLVANFAPLTLAQLLDKDMPLNLTTTLEFTDRPKAEESFKATLTRDADQAPQIQFGYTDKAHSEVLAPPQKLDCRPF